MSQRNPMNQRYQGEGPSGQTRKSATSAKPASAAASSVHVKKKPVTDAEKRAARKQREKEQARKAEERQRRQRAREQALAEARESEAEPEPKKKKNPLSGIIGVNPNVPNSEEYRKWRRVYWILMVIGIVAVAVLMFYYLRINSTTTPFFFVFITIAYGAIIGALIIDFTKVKPLIRAAKSGTNKAKTPKQLKHQQEAAAEAARIEAARKAARATRRLPLRRRTIAAEKDADDVGDTGDAGGAGASGEEGASDETL
ncbi:MAG: hypothetical protein LBO07_06440 [Coriobacteriales bacterium]|jgi:uncharacterized integral membrane protein|nr:hypothetical protein [Coriobacteriales bacterium]